MPSIDNPPLEWETKFHAITKQGSKLLLCLNFYIVSQETEKKFS
jgi:hypothetical protein